jgi:phage shock protein A
MSMWQRLSQVMQQKINRMLERAENPAEALDLAYAQQLTALQQVRRNVAEVLTSEKRLELQAAQLKQGHGKLQEQARAAVAQGRDDLARIALTRAQAAQVQIEGLHQQIELLQVQEQKLELTAQKLQAKVEAFRTQKETIKAQYSAAQASAMIGEAVTGLSEQMADVGAMVDRAQDKTAQMQARAAALDQLMDTGVLGQIGAGTIDDVDRQLQAMTSTAQIEDQLMVLKRQLPAASVRTLPEHGVVVRIQGEDQYRITRTDRDRLERLDRRLVGAVKAGQVAEFQSVLKETLDLVRNSGQILGSDQLVASDIVLPPDDMSLEEARRILLPEARPKATKTNP